jgi:hypothetical protein
MDKFCSKCGQSRTAGEFYRDTKRHDGLQCWCKVCQKQKQKESYDFDSYKDRKLRSLYGITGETYKNLLTLQSSGCVLCGWTMTEDSEQLCVDHDHETGNVRQLICRKCNLALGHVNDRIDVLANMIAYLERHRKT